MRFRLPDEEVKRCALCGQQHYKDDMHRRGSEWLCAECESFMRESAALVDELSRIRWTVKRG